MLLGVLRRRRHQGRAARRRRSAAHLAARAQRHRAVVVCDGAQQALHHRRPPPRGGTRAHPPAGGAVRRRGGELPARPHGGLGARLRRAQGHQSAADHGPHLGLRSDRAVRASARVRGGGRGHGRTALRQRLPGPPAGPRQPEPGRHDRRTARGARAAARTPPSRRQGHRRRTDGRRRALRVDLQPDGVDAARVRDGRRGPRAPRLDGERHRADQRVSRAPMAATSSSAAMPTASSAGSCAPSNAPISPRIHDWRPTMAACRTHR